MPQIVLGRRGAAAETAAELIQFLKQERAVRLPSAEPTGLDIYATEIRAAEVTRWLLLLSEVRVWGVRDDLNATASAPNPPCRSFPFPGLSHRATIRTA